jgi:hypothetical protein
MMYFVGNKPGYFPYAKGPIRYVAARSLDALMTARQVESILRHLGFTQDEQRAFWGDVQEYRDYGADIQRRL